MMKLIAIGGAIVLSVGVGISLLPGSHLPELTELTENAPETVVTLPASPEYSPEELASMTPDRLLQMQQDSLSAVAARSNEPRELTQLSGRPEFVSPAEWMMLQAVSRQKENSDAELLRLVNLLRFNKQLELLSGTVTDSDKALFTEAVLAQIPARIKNQEMSVAKAQAIQLRLIRELYEEDSEIRARAAEEAQRIGAEFSFKAS